MNKMCTKVCSYCKKELISSLFHKGSAPDGLAAYCKNCTYDYALENRNTILGYKRKYNEKKRLERIAKNPETEEQRTARLLANAEKSRKNKIEKTALRNKANPEKKKAYNRRYREKTRIERNRKDKERKSKDPSYRISVNLRVRLNKAIKNDQKSGSAVLDLGCSVEYLKQYLESQFDSWMSWDNYGKGPGKWQIDHKMALCLFNLENRDEFLKATHYTNLQPLGYEEHLQKTTTDILKKKAA
jgi:hypothetical protein